MQWWAITFEEPYPGRVGYQAMSSNYPGNPVGVFFDDGTSPPSVPGYSYVTTSMNATPPSWAASVSDLP